MTKKQYKALEIAVEGFMLTILLATIATVLLGVYGLASLVF